MDKVASLMALTSLLQRIAKSARPLKSPLCIEENMETCPICSQDIQWAGKGSRDAYSVNCPLCGKYGLTRTVLANLRNTSFTLRQRANISAWLRENPDFEVSTANVDTLSNLTTPSFHERADSLLLFFEKNTSYAGETVAKDISWISHGWCINQEELNEIISFLTTIGRISQDDTLSKSWVKIEPNGWEHLEKIKTFNAESDQCFVAMWFSDELKKIYDEAISLGILEAGYRPHRVDQREHNDKIDDEIIAQIRRSRIVLADFTGHRGGVYFEAGFAKGLNIEVVWTCREDDLPNLHFDIRQYNCIVWSESKLLEFKDKIKNRIGSVIGFGKGNA